MFNSQFLAANNNTTGYFTGSTNAPVNPYDPYRFATTTSKMAPPPITAANRQNLNCTYNPNAINVSYSTYAPTNPSLIPAPSTLLNSGHSNFIGVGIVDDNDFETAIVSTKALNKQLSKLNAEMYNDYGIGAGLSGSGYASSYLNAGGIGVGGGGIGVGGGGGGGGGGGRTVKYVTTLDSGDDDLFNLIQKSSKFHQPHQHQQIPSASYPTVTTSSTLTNNNNNNNSIKNFASSSYPMMMSSSISNAAAAASASAATAAAAANYFVTNSNSSGLQAMPSTTSTTAATTGLVKDYFPQIKQRYSEYEPKLSSSTTNAATAILSSGGTQLPTASKSYLNYASNYSLAGADPTTATSVLTATNTHSTAANNSSSMQQQQDPQQELNDYYKLAAKRTKQRTNYNRAYAAAALGATITEDENGNGGGGGGGSSILNPLYDTQKYMPSYDANSRAVLNSLCDDRTYTEIKRKSWFDEPCNQHVPLSKRSQMWRPKSPPRSFEDRYRQSRRLSMSDALNKYTNQTNLSTSTTLHPSGQQSSQHQQQQQQSTQQQQQQQPQVGGGGGMPSTLKDLETLNKRTSELLSDLNRKFQNM